MESYKTIKRRGVGTFRDKGSKFIGIAIEFSDTNKLNDCLQDVSTDYPNATHYCYAYLSEPENEVYRANDDGEPSGTAGLPILGQIKSNELVNVLIVVVRYYGGTKLGTTGLKNAYKQAATLAIEDAGTIKRLITTTFQLQYGYGDTAEVNLQLNQFNARILNEQFEENCVVVFEVPKDSANEMLNYFVNKSNFVIVQKD